MQLPQRAILNMRTIIAVKKTAKSKRFLYGLSLVGDELILFLLYLSAILT